MGIHATTLVMVLFGFACFMVGFAKAGFGGALGFFITPTLALVLPLHTVVGIMLPVLMVADIFTIAAYWRRWDTRRTLIMVAGAVVGVTLATFVLVNTSPELLKKGLAALVLIFVIYRLLEKHILTRLIYRPRAWHGVLAGTAGGFTSALANAGGPPVSVYLLLQDLEPTLFVATSSLFFAIVNWVKIPYFLAGGLIDFQLLRELVWLLPLVPVGVWAGRRMVGVVNKTLFDRLVIVFLLISGILLVV
jgi:uncharacterized membrane protein YfcA